MDIMELVRKKKQAIQATSGRREKTHKPQPGKSKFRILPTWRQDGDPTFFKDFGQHFIKDTSDKLQAVYMCVEKTHGEPCPICTGIQQGIMRATDDDIIKALKDSQASSRVLFNALHLDGDDPSTPIILDVSPTTAEKILDLMEDYGNITDLNEGTDIIINRSGKGLNTEYSIVPAPKSNPVDASVLKNLQNLDDYVKQEFDEGRNKALTAVSNVSGLLAAPSTTAIASSGSAAALAAPAYDEEYGSIPASDDIEFSEPKSAAAPKTAVDVATSAAPDDLSVEDLDAMLASLE